MSAQPQPHPNDVIVTTTNNVEGYTIQRSLGIDPWRS